MLAAGLAGAALLWHADPNAPGSLLPPCPFATLTGLFCPGCGATRALHALLHLDVAGAFAMNPLLVLCLPLLALFGLHFAGWLPAHAAPLLRRPRCRSSARGWRRSPGWRAMPGATGQPRSIRWPRRRRLPRPNCPAATACA